MRITTSAYDGYVTNCFIRSRNGEHPVFGDGSQFNGYAVIPLEEYRAMLAGDPVPNAPSVSDIDPMIERANAFDPTNISLA